MGSEEDFILRAASKIVSYIRDLEIEDLEALKRAISRESNAEAIEVVLYALLFYPKRVILEKAKRYDLTVFIPRTGEVLETNVLNIVESVKRLLKEGYLKEAIEELKTFDSPRYFYLSSV